MDDKISRRNFLKTSVLNASILLSICFAVEIAARLTLDPEEQHEEMHDANCAQNCLVVGTAFL
jgi:hypothetical protein